MATTTNITAVATHTSQEAYDANKAFMIAKYGPGTVGEGYVTYEFNDATMTITWVKTSATGYLPN